MGEESESVCDEDRYYVSGAPTTFGVLLTWSTRRRHVMGIFVIELMSEIMSSVIQKNFGYFCLLFGQEIANLVILYNCITV